MKKMTSLFLVLIIISALLMPATNAAEANPMLRVGLAYGTGALPSANLANEAGSGYEFGYFDANNSFVPLYRTREEKISVLKDKLIYIDGDYAYADAPPATSSGTVGPYHLQASQIFSSMENAAAYADSVTGAGIRAFPAYINGQFVVRIGEYKTADEANAAMSAAASAASDANLTAVGESATCLTVTITKTFHILFEFDTGGAYLAIRPISSGAKPKTWFKGYCYYGAFEYKRINSNDVTVINVIEMQDYIKCVIPYEMSPSWPLEALKAQALCAKSYALSYFGKHASYGFDLCNTTDCQVYSGTALANADSDRAVDETYGYYVLYQGKNVTTFYHSSNGGSTEDSENVWRTVIPYLRAVSDPFEKLTNTTNSYWRYETDLATMTKILQSKGKNVTSLIDVYVSEYTKAGNVLTLTFVDANGQRLSFSREDARTILNSPAYGVQTKSMRYTIGTLTDLYINGQKMAGGIGSHYAIGAKGEVKLVSASTPSLLSKGGTGVADTGKSSTYVIEGSGWGHNVGMSQYGAKGMAEQGYTFDQIIKYYFTGVDVVYAP